MRFENGKALTRFVESEITWKIPFSPLSPLGVYGRQLKIMDYADVFTQKVFEEKKSKTLALIKPDAYQNTGKIVAMIQASGLTIANMQMLKMTREFAAEQYAEHKGKVMKNNHRFWNGENPSFWTRKSAYFAPHSP